MKETLSFTTRQMRAEEAELERFKACFDYNGSPRTLKHLIWQYFNIPANKVFADVAVGIQEEKEIFAGIYAVFPLKIKVGNRVVLASQSLDTMTDIRYRKNGIFKKLGASLYIRLEKENIAFVYGFPSKNSIYGVEKRLGWKILDPVPFLIRPLRTGYIMKKFGLKKGSNFFNIKLPVRLFPSVCKCNIRSINNFDERFDNLWNIVSSNINTGVVRDSTYLSWRFDKNPSFSYSTLAAFHNETLLGFVTYRLAKKHGGTIGYLMELLEKPGAQVMKSLLTKALISMKKDGADVVLAWNMRHSFNHSIFKKLGFFSFPERIRPIELHFGVRSFGNESVLQRKNWYVSYCDSDTV